MQETVEPLTTLFPNYFFSLFRFHAPERDVMSSETDAAEDRGLSFFERYLSVWVILCIAAGIVLPAVNAMQRSAGTAAGRNTVYGRSWESAYSRNHNSASALVF